MHRTNLSLLVVFLLISVHGFGQNGLGLWVGLGAEKKINKKLGINLNVQSRFTDDISYMQSYFAEAGVAYEFLKNTEIAVNYRYIMRRKNETKDFKNRQRYYTDLAHSFKVHKIKIENRLRYQRQFKDNEGELEIDADYLRYKLGFELKTKAKLSPYISNDIFYQIGAKIDQLRPKIGLNYKISKAQAIDISLFKNLDLLDAGRSSGPIVGLNYKLKF